MWVLKLLWFYNVCIRNDHPKNHHAHPGWCVTMGTFWQAAPQWTVFLRWKLTLILITCPGGVQFLCSPFKGRHQKNFFFGEHQTVPCESLVSREFFSNFTSRSRSRGIFISLFTLDLDFETFPFHFSISILRYFHFTFHSQTSQELRMLSPSLFIQGSQCKC